MQGTGVYVRVPQPDGGVEEQELLLSCFGTQEELRRSCVDCGMLTGAFCDLECLARARIPSEQWLRDQLTPHCSACDAKYGSCHFCRGVSWATPGEWRSQDTVGTEYEGIIIGE